MKEGAKFPAVNLFIYNSHNTLRASRATFQWGLNCIVLLYKSYNSKLNPLWVRIHFTSFYSNYHSKICLDFNLIFYGFSPNAPQLDSKKYQVPLHQNLVHALARHHQPNHILYNLKTTIKWTITSTRKFILATYRAQMFNHKTTPVSITIKRRCRAWPPKQRALIVKQLHAKKQARDFRQSTSSYITSTFPQAIYGSFIVGS